MVHVQHQPRQPPLLNAKEQFWNSLESEEDVKLAKAEDCGSLEELREAQRRMQERERKAWEAQRQQIQKNERERQRKAEQEKWQREMIREEAKKRHDLARVKKRALAEQVVEAGDYGDGKWWIQVDRTTWKEVQGKYFCPLCEKHLDDHNLEAHLMSTTHKNRVEQSQGHGSFDAPPRPLRPVAPAAALNPVPEDGPLPSSPSQSSATSAPPWNRAARDEPASRPRPPSTPTPAPATLAPPPPESPSRPPTSLGPVPPSSAASAQTAVPWGAAPCTAAPQPAPRAAPHAAPQQHGLRPQAAAAPPTAPYAAGPHAAPLVAARPDNLPSWQSRDADGTVRCVPCRKVCDDSHLCSAEHERRMAWFLAEASRGQSAAAPHAAAPYAAGPYAPLVAARPDHLQSWQSMNADGTVRCIPCGKVCDDSHLCSSEHARRIAWHTEQETSRCMGFEPPELEYIAWVPIYGEHDEGGERWKKCLLCNKWINDEWSHSGTPTNLAGSKEHQKNLRHYVNTPWYEVNVLAVRRRWHPPGGTAPRRIPATPCYQAPSPVMPVAAPCTAQASPCPAPAAQMPLPPTHPRPTVQFRAAGPEDEGLIEEC